MRGAVEDLATPQPLGPALPPVYQDDGFAVRFVSGFDDVLAPVLSTLDNFAAYLDPALAPEDFLVWLSGWVGVTLDENWPLERRRELVGRAAHLFRWRGTVRGLAGHVALSTGAETEVEDSGGCIWSPTPGGAPPGSPEAKVRVRVRVEDTSAVDVRRLHAIVAAATPAHVLHEIEIEVAKP